MLDLEEDDHWGRCARRSQNCKNKEDMLINSRHWVNIGRIMCELCVMCELTHNK